MGVLDLQTRVLTGQPWRISFTGSDAELATAREYPQAQYNKTKDRVSFELDLRVLTWFRSYPALAPPLTKFTSTLLAWENALLAAQARVASIRGAKYTRTVVDLPYQSKLYDYQTVGIQWLANVKRGILADEPGLGKTIQALAAADLVGAKKIAVFTVNLVVQNQFQRTIQDWGLGTSVVVTGTKAERLAATKKDVRWYIMPNTLLAGSKEFDKFFAQKFDVVIIDEAHQFQSKDSKRGKKAATLKSDYLFLLTGTPIWNKIPSLWNLLHIVDKHRWSSYWAWITRYCVTYKTPFGMQVGKVKDNMEDDLKKEVAEVMLRRELVQVFTEFPEATTVNVELEMPDDIATGYRAIRDRVMKYLPIRLGEKKIEISTTAQAIPILRQYLNNPVSWAGLDSSCGNPKLDKVVDIVEKSKALGLSVLVFTWHTDFADHIAAAIPGARSTHGKKSAGERAQDVADFQSGKFGCLVASLASLGTGVDLPDVDVLVFAECDWTPAMIEQGWRRIYRITSKHAKMILFVFYKKTVEERIYKAFQTKQAISDEVLAQEILHE